MFAGISLFVGVFIIFNSFSITIQQRLRELGCCARSARAADRSSALVIARGSCWACRVGAGLALGLALAPGLKALFEAVGVDLPSNGLRVKPRTVYVPLIVGTLVALLSSLVPAIRATRVSPMASLQAAAVPTVGRVAAARRSSRASSRSAGVGLILLGLFGSAGRTAGAWPRLGFGVAAAFLAVALLSPWLVRPLASRDGPAGRALRGLPPAAWRARTRCASRRAPRRPPRR